MVNKIIIGDIIYIPTEGKEYNVYGVQDNQVKLINYQSKEKLTIDKETYLDIKELTENIDKKYLAELLVEGLDLLDYNSENIEF